MSEYQYYEFQAVDRPLTPEQMAELRTLTSRAQITPTRLQNVYHWGDFRGDPRRLMETYFDAFVYVANWGTNQLMLRLPSRLLAPETARRYAVEGTMEVRTTGDWLILNLHSEEGGGRWIEDEESEAWMPALLPLRAELAGGDLRALYLAWLAAAQHEWFDEEHDEQSEPPVPVGLGALTAAQHTLAAFLRIDEDMLAAAAVASGAPPETPSPDELGHWLTGLAPAEKDALLLRFATGNDANLRAEILARFRRASGGRSRPPAPRRTAAQLRAVAAERAERRRREEAERRAVERARREREQAAARARYLDSIAGREDELWRQTEALIEMKRSKEYDQALQLLQDLHDLSVRQGDTAAFQARLDSLRARYAKRPGVMQRLKRAGLTG